MLFRSPAPDRSHPAMAVNLDACIHCNLCVRACREVQVNDVIGMAGRGHGEKIVFDFDDPMGASTCVACGECVQACPTGALMPATLVDEGNVFTGKADRTVDSVCPYCGVGCQLTYHIKDDKLLYVTGKNGPANENRLCVKGRFGDKRGDKRQGGDVEDFHGEVSRRGFEGKATPKLQRAKQPINGGGPRGLTHRKRENSVHFGLCGNFDNSPTGRQTA